MRERFIQNVMVRHNLKACRYNYYTTILSDAKRGAIVQYSSQTAFAKVETSNDRQHLISVFEHISLGPKIHIYTKIHIKSLLMSEKSKDIISVMIKDQ